MYLDLQWKQNMALMNTKTLTEHQGVHSCEVGVKLE